MHSRIHPTVIIEGDVRLGRDNVLLPYTVLQGPLEIGDDNIIGPLAVIGGPGQDTRNPRYDHAAKPVRIGSHNIIREHVAIQKPIGEGLTFVGDYAHLMHGAHIPHDAWIEDHVVVTPGSVISGFARILVGANLGINCAIHQHCVVGQFSLVAMGAAVSKNVRPFSRYIPGKPLSVNAYAIEKYDFGKYAAEITRYVLHNVPPASTEIAAIVDRYERLHEASGRQQYR